MKKYLLIVSLLMAAFAAQALPFEPTLDPHSSTTKWYYLIIDNLYVQSVQKSFGSTIYYVTSMGFAHSGTSVDQWCFVDDGNGKYKVYNREYKRYLCDDGYLESEFSVYYEARTSDTFYLLRKYISDGATVIMNLYYDSEENALMTESTTGNVLHGYFSAQFADQGSDATNPQSSWTRYDASGVGYKFVAGGSSSVENEGVSNLCDGNAATKYCGTAVNCWITMQASQEVAVQQYSIVTANDSRAYYDRSLRSWTLLGSNDNANWVLIDEQSNYPMPFEDQVEVVIPVNDNRKFKYFKFSCTGSVTNNNTSIVQLSEVWINKETHDSWDVISTHDHGCGYPLVSKLQCGKCHIYKNELLEPASQHNYVDGKCSVCGMKENETMLLYNGQKLTPYYVKALYANRNSDGTWLSAPAGWNDVSFFDNYWIDLPMPTASYNHSSGPYKSLQYNSFWYDEYNCWWMRRVFNIDELMPNASYILRCVHDDNMVVYVNGQEVINAEGWTATPNNCTWETAYEEFVIPASVFRMGENVLAIYIQQNWGGAYFDCDLRRIISNAVAGDVTGDGKVDVMDVNALINIILELKTEADYVGNADLNGDDKVDVEDVNACINIILAN